ncbi:hypothetical protein D3C72_2354790 [compost metagenome]
MVDDLDQPLGLQLAQRLAHRHAADAVFIGKGLLAQLLSVGKFAGQDALAQGFCNRTGQGLAFDRLQGGHGHALAIGYMQMYSIIR